MSGKARDRRRTSPSTGSPRRQRPADSRLFGVPIGLAAIAGAVVVVLVLAIGGVLLMNNNGGHGSAASPSQWAVQGTNGRWTNVNPDRLAEMLASKDFTLVNVKTPYFAEIEKTDLFIPYDQIASQASKLPQDRAAKIVVYCRSGVESRQAAEALVSLGYTNVWNLDGGMLGWQSSGRELLYTHKP